MGICGNCSMAAPSPDYRFADLDFNVGDIVFSKELAALGDHDDAIFARERVGHHADPEDDRGVSEIRFHDPNADDVDAGPLHLHRVQKAIDPGTELVLPDSFEWCVVANRVNLLFLLWAGGCLPRSGAAASD
jgi:hypothetical protein